MANYIICGIDAHEESLFCWIAIDKETPKVMKYANTMDGRDSLFWELKDLSNANGDAKVAVAYEASPLGYVLYDDCVDEGFECYILAPTKIPKAAKDRKNKHDKKDARKIFEILRGHLLAGNELPEIWIPDDETRDDRETVRSRLDVGNKQTRVKTQIQMLLKRKRMQKPEEICTTWTKEYRKWLMGLELERGARNCLRTLVRQLERLEEEIKILDREIYELSQTDRYKEPAEALMSLGGVGLLTALVYLTEMGDLRRFNNRKEIGSFLGLVPSIAESGETDDRKGHITHEGPARVRKVLCQATWYRVRMEEGEKRVYERIAVKNPKHKKIAVVACMRRLGILMWHIGLEAQRRTGCFCDEEVMERAAVQ